MLKFDLISPVTAVYAPELPGEGRGNHRTYQNCPADFNQDGFIDFFDYDAFVACFEGAGCPPGLTADVTNDGFVDFFDYDLFVALYETGCVPAGG